MMAAGPLKEISESNRSTSVKASASVADTSDIGSLKTEPSSGTVEITSGAELSKTNVAR